MSHNDDTLRQALLSPSTDSSSSSPPEERTAFQDTNNKSHPETSFLARLERSQQQEPCAAIPCDEHPEEEDDHEQARHSFLRSYNNGLMKFYKLLLVALPLVWLWGGWSLMRLTQETDSTVHPLAHTPSALAQDAFLQKYNNNNNNNSVESDGDPPLFVVLESTTNDTSLTQPTSLAFHEARNFLRGLEQDLRRRVCGYTQNMTVNSNSNDYDDCRSKLQMTSYYSLRDADLGLLASAMATPDGRMVLMQIQHNLLKQDRMLVMDAIDKSRNNYYAAHEKATNHSYFFDVRVTGIPVFQADLQQSARKDLIRMGLVVLPLALVLVGIVLLPATRRANPRVLWMIPLVTVMTTVACWSIVTRFVVAKVLQISPFTPTIMMSLSIGMGMNYTLFLLARYLEEYNNNSTITTVDCRHRRQHEAVFRMLLHQGHVLILSGTTLLCTFLGLVVLPLPMLQSVGVGAAVTIASSLLVNLTLVPALLYTRLGKWIVAYKEQQQQEDDAEENGDNEGHDDNDVAEPRSNHGHLAHPLVSASPPPPLPPSLWHFVSKHLLHPYRGIIILLVAFQILLPVAQYATQIKSSLSFDLVLPATSPSLQTFHSLGEKFGYGRLHPYRILFDGTSANLTMTSAAGFDIMHRVVDELAALDETMFGNLNNISTTLVGMAGDDVESLARYMGAEFQYGKDQLLNDALKQIYDGEHLQRMKKKRTSYSGIAVLKNAKIPHSIFVSAKYCSLIKPYCPFQLLHVIDVIDKSATSDDMYATYVSATLGVSPFSAEGLAWLESARETLRRLEESKTLGGVKLYLQGAAAIEYDAVEAVYDAFPKMIVITTLVVFCLMGTFFGSVFLPFRCIVGIGLTLSFSFGLGVLVYQNGIFDWTGVRALSSVGGNEFCWLVPIMAFSVIVGLALDYDVFLVSRILEYRLQGYEHKTSIAAGLHSTGGIITAAGLIMAFAFGSLMLTSNPVLYQWSFLLTTAVLLETFVIRTIVVPTMTSLAGRCCWWPREMPPTRVTMPEHEGGLDDVSSLLRSLEESSEYEPLLNSPRTP